MDKIRSFEEDPCYKYYTNLIVLRFNTDRDNFRLDFLYQYMDMKEEDEDEYDEWTDDDYKPIYRKFWKHFLALDPKSTLVTYLYSCFTKFENPYEMLTDDLVDKIEKKMEENVGKTEIEVELNRELKRLAI